MDVKSNRKARRNSSDSSKSNSPISHNNERKTHQKRSKHSESEDSDSPPRRKEQPLDSDVRNMYTKRRGTSPDDNRYRRKRDNRSRSRSNERRQRSRSREREDRRSEGKRRDSRRDYGRTSYKDDDHMDDRKHDTDKYHRRRDSSGERQRDIPDRKYDRNSQNNRYGNRRGRGNYHRNNRRNRSRSKSFDHANANWGKNENNQDKAEKRDAPEKEKPNFALSGKLTEETNTYKGVVIKYSEPPEARKPRRRWRLYPFKGEKALQTLYIHRESAYLIGRDRKVVDLPVDHPSCSKQHAALQYRLVPFTREDGSAGKRVRPYIIDLESANGTYINNKRIDAKKYVELLERDVLKFGFSSREYVLLHENSKDEAMDDDVKQEEEELVVKTEPN